MKRYKRKKRIYEQREKEKKRLNLARWRDGEMARREERDSEIDFFTKRKREKEKKRKREKNLELNLGGFVVPALAVAPNRRNGVRRYKKRLSNW